MNEESLLNANILIVDDKEINIMLITNILRRAGFHQLFCTTDSSTIISSLIEVKPDIVLLDLHMPRVDGIAALRLIREHIPQTNLLPVLMLTADVDPEAKKLAFQSGANDILIKPYDRMEVVLRIQNLLRTRFLQVQLMQHNDSLEERVRERTLELQQAKQEILKLLGKASEYRDDMTGQHTQRVGRLSGLIAEQLGIEPRHVELIRMAAPLHDIGKIGIPDEILLKPGRFEPHEFDRMKQHTMIGASILEGSYFTVLKLAGVIAQFHHEKWDGSGYPFGLQGVAIPIEARIVALADFYDALTHERPYKKAWSHQEALDEIVRQRGLHFDPAIVDVFVGLYWTERLELSEGELLA